MDKEEIKALATELITELVEEMRPELGDNVRKQNDAYIITFTATHPAGDSFFHFNPQPSAERIVQQHASHEEMAAAEFDAARVRQESKKQIKYMIALAGQNFADSLWILLHMSEVYRRDEHLPFYPERDETNRLFIPDSIEFRYRQRLGLPVDEAFQNVIEGQERMGAPYAFTDEVALKAIEALGWKPSINKLASALHCSRATVNAWVARKGYTSLAKLLEAHRPEKGGVKK
ncbi:MAG TPA: hypothetical protein VF546_05410 [Pyrinomonadaceae bacterium]